MTAAFRMRSRNIDSVPVGATKRLRTVAAMAIVGGVLVQCTSAPPMPPAASPPPPATRSSPSAPTSTPPPPQPPARQIAHPVTAADLGTSWRPGCPLEPQRLRRVEINYLGFDGQTHRGELIVHETWWPRSSRSSSNFINCAIPSRRCKRSTTIRPPTMSYPCKTTTPRRSTAETSPAPADGPSTPTAERSISTRYSTPSSTARALSNPEPPRHTSTAAALIPGLLHDGDPAVRVFTDRGWRWGGYWRTLNDYQHFERS